MNPDNQPRAIPKSLRWAGAAVLVLVILVAAWRLTRSSADDKTEAEPVVRVRTAVAERGPIAEEVAALGIIAPRRQATVSAKISAPIARMDLLKNRSVQAGDVLVVLEAGDLRAQLAEAKSALEEARIAEQNASSGTIPQSVAETEKALQDAQANAESARALYERRRSLYDQGGIAKKDLDDAQLALTTAENQLHLAERTANLRAGTMEPNERALAAARVREAEDRVASLEVQVGYATIRAPFRGIVTDQYQFQGEYAAAGARLFTIADLGDLIVKASFPDTVAYRIRTGNPATVEPKDLPGQSFRGSVSLVSRAADPLNRTIEVWIDLIPIPPDLRPFTPAQTRIVTRRIPDAILVPAAAVTLASPDGDTGTVMVVDAGSVARERQVRTGIRSGDRIQILRGLKAGETVVTEGNYALPDGTRVQAAEEAKTTSGEGGRK
jgi:multidrug efflux pump subunit AcrA (membrane-fusion protein)